MTKEPLSQYKSGSLAMPKSHFHTPKQALSDVISGLFAVGFHHFGKVLLHNILTINAIQNNNKNGIFGTGKELMENNARRTDES